MICKDCTDGARMYKLSADPAIARDLHKRCPGCDCQHKSNVIIGIDWNKVNEQKRTEEV